MMANHPAHYKAYVIRCWEEQSPSTKTTTYRFTLELPGTGQRFGFTSSKALMDEIERRLTEHSTTKTDEPIDGLSDESIDES